MSFSRLQLKRDVPGQSRNKMPTIENVRSPDRTWDISCWVVRCRSKNASRVIVSPCATAKRRRFSTSTHSLRISAMASRRGGKNENNPVLRALDACLNLKALMVLFHTVKLFHRRYSSKKDILWRIECCFVTREWVVDKDGMGKGGRGEGGLDVWCRGGTQFYKCCTICTYIESAVVRRGPRFEGVMGEGKGNNHMRIGIIGPCCS